MNDFVRDYARQASLGRVTHASRAPRSDRPSPSERFGTSLEVRNGVGVVRPGAPDEGQP